MNREQTVKILQELQANYIKQDADEETKDIYCALDFAIADMELLQDIRTKVRYVRGK